MARVFVTGANGFIGTHLVEFLRERGDAVVRMVYEGPGERSLRDKGGAEGMSDTVFASLDDVDAMASAMSGCELVYHLAGRTWSFDRAGFEATNVQGVDKLFQAIALAGSPPSRVVFVSSLMAAGPSDAQVPRGEAHRTHEGFTHYGDSKLAGERVAFERLREGEAPDVVIVRPPMVYGPGEPDAASLIKSASKGLIAHPSLRLAPVSMIHVGDLVRGLAAVADHGQPLPRRGPHVLAGAQGQDPATPLLDPVDPIARGIYYLSDGTRHDASSLARAALAHLGKRALTVRFPAPAIFTLAWFSSVVARARGTRPLLSVDKARGILSRGWWCDDRRALAELNWAPRVDLEAGVADSIKWLVDTKQL